MVTAALALIGWSIEAPPSPEPEPVLEEAPIPASPSPAVAADRLEDAVRRLRASPSADREAAERAVAVLETNCAYNRATFQLVWTLARELPELDASTLNAAERARFDQLLRGVAAQDELSTLLGGDALPEPLVVDHLFGDFAKGPRRFLDGAALAESPDPVGETEALLEQVPELTASLSGTSLRQIERAWETLDATVARETWFGAVSAWSEALDELAPSLARGATGTRAMRLRDLLKDHSGRGC